MEPVVRSVYGAALQTAMLLGVPHKIKPNTTLNERFDVEKNAIHPDTVWPRVGYFCIGNGGHGLTAGTDGIPYVKSRQHEATNSNLFKPLPFVLRPITDDLPPLQRAKYAMRRQETHMGQVYYAYYLKRMDNASLDVGMQKRIIDKGITTTSDFIPSTSDLVPQPPAIVNTGANLTTSSYITVSTLLALNLTAEDCKELLDVASIIYGDQNYAIISEIGLCSGVDKTLTLNDGSVYKESISTQIVSFISAFHQVSFTASGISGLFDIGSNEPLLTVA